MAIAVQRPEQRRTDARFEALVLDFLAYLEFERGLARNTLDAYRTDLLQYGAFLAERDDGGHGGRSCRRRRLPRRPRDRHAGGRGRQRRPRAVLAGDDQPQDGVPALVLPPSAPRGADRRRPDGDPEPAAQVAASCRRCSATAEVERLLESTARSDPIELRDRALLEVMYGCGLRASETIGLEVGDVDLRAPVRAPARARARRSGSCPLGRRGRARDRALPAGRPAGAGRRAGRAQAVRQLPRRGADPPGPLQDHPAPREARRASTAR